MFDFKTRLAERYISNIYIACDQSVDFVWNLMLGD